MKNKNSLILGFLAIILLSGCLDLSPLLFNPEQVDEYLYEDWDSGDFNLPSQYDLLPGELSEFTVESDLNGDLATIYGAYLGDISTIDQDTVILYCHGNSAHMDVYYQRAKLLYNAQGKSNYGVLLFDYRGFGRSEGTTTESGLIADTQAMIEWLISNGLDSERFMIYGFSLGSIPAVSACINDYGIIPSRLMLEAPIGSIDAMAQDGSGLSIHGSNFADLKTNNIEDIKLVEQPLFWIHGTDDDFLAQDTHGAPVFLNHVGLFKTPISVEGGGHGDIPFIMGWEEYISSVEDFIVRIP